MPAKLVENRQPPASRGGSDDACLKKDGEALDFTDAGTLLQKHCNKCRRLFFEPQKKIKAYLLLPAGRYR